MKLSLLRSLFTVIIAIPFFNIAYPQTERKEYIYSNVANIRAGVGTEYDKTDELYCGNEITVLEETETITEINGYRAPWIKIEYTKDGQTKTGYIWKGNLSFQQLRRGDTKFVFGVESYNEEKYRYLGKIKAIRDREVVSSHSFATSSTLSYVHAKILDKPQLDNVNNIITLTFDREACGEIGEDFYYAWDGERLNYITSTYSVSDAGAYYHLENIIFPTGGTYTDIIIKLIREGTMEEDDTDYKSTYNSEIYLWNGNKIELQK